MKVSIRAITIPNQRVSEGTWTPMEDLREVTTIAQDSHGTEMKFRLPAVEVDGIINVGSIYELIFARRES